jgi:GNAT superfamily N-acetyltransferase
MGFHLRPASEDERETLEALIARSARGLSQADYTDAQTEAAIRHVFGVDSELVADGTYFVAEEDGVPIACGGWSRRKTLFGGDRYAARQSGLLDPATEPAKIRAFFVHPDHARKGVGRALLAHCEAEAKRHGFTRCEMMATLPGVKFYRAAGYADREAFLQPTPEGVVIPFLRMEKSL